MGLTIKGQCIPDVTRPAEGGRAAGFGDRRSGAEAAEVRRGAQSRRRGPGAAGGGGEAPPLPGSWPPGPGGPQLARGDLNFPLPGWHLERGVRLPPRRHLPPAARRAAAWLGRRADGAGVRPSVRVSSRALCARRREGEQGAAHVSDACGASLCPVAGCQPGLNFFLGGGEVTYIGECDRRG